jgi:hypothetical protein
MEREAMFENVPQCPICAFMGRINIHAPALRVDERANHCAVTTPAILGLEHIYGRIMKICSWALSCGDALLAIDDVGRNPIDQFCFSLKAERRKSSTSMTHLRGWRRAGWCLGAIVCPIQHPRHHRLYRLRGLAPFAG